MRTNSIVRGKKGVPQENRTIRAQPGRIVAALTCRRDARTE